MLRLKACAITAHSSATLRSGQHTKVHTGKRQASCGLPVTLVTAIRQNPLSTNVPGSWCEFTWKLLYNLFNLNQVAATGHSRLFPTSILMASASHHFLQGLVSWEQEDTISSCQRARSLMPGQKCSSQEPASRAPAYTTLEGKIVVLPTLEDADLWVTRQGRCTS